MRSGPGAAVLAALALVAGCTRPLPDADVIVVGGGIAGLSAALEAGASGRSVIVLDANSVGGGHAVKAGGFALVGTPLQAQKGYQDSPEIAERDLLAWGEDADAAWVGRYVRASRQDVHDWLTGFGVKWGFILDTPEHSVPRFHFANGSALNVVVPLMRAAFERPNLDFRLNTEVTGLVRSGRTVTGVRVRNLRTGEERELHAPAVILATGGWQGNLDFVRREWRRDLPAPERLYAGAGYFALGSGIGLGREAGAATRRMDHQVTFTTGLPDPRNPGRALLTQNPAAIWVDRDGRRFVSELASTKVADAAVLRQSPATHWLVFDADGLKTLRVRDAVWLGNAPGIAPLEAAGLIQSAGSLPELAAKAGLPPAGLQATVARWNAALAAGDDPDFGRFSRAKPDPAARPLVRAPFYAIQLFPLTRKSMGGLAIDEDTRVVDDAGRPIAGLYAAGEVTGVAGINGSYGGEGTFLGPSVWLGRLAGQAAARGDAAPPRPPSVVPPPAAVTPSADPGYRARAITVDAAALPALLEARRPGYWHFEAAHRIVLERNLDCTACHAPDWPTREAATPVQRQLQLNACRTCH